VQTRYRDLLADHGPELGILRHVAPPALPEDVATAVSRLRSGLVKRVAGYDGVYGSIRALG
jgi:PHP family Zn ribbon phosphoesterase